MTPHVHVADRNMDMTVKEARQHRAACDIDLRVDVKFGSHVPDQAVLDDDVSLAEWRTGAVEEPAAAEESAWHGSPPVRTAKSLRQHTGGQHIRAPWPLRE